MDTSKVKCGCGALYAPVGRNRKCGACYRADGQAAMLLRVGEVAPRALTWAGATLGDPCALGAPPAPEPVRKERAPECARRWAARREARNGGPLASLRHELLALPGVQEVTIEVDRGRHSDQDILRIKSPQHISPDAWMAILNARPSDCPTRRFRWAHLDTPPGPFRY